MTATVKTETAEDIHATEFEGEIREFIRKDVAPWRKRAEIATDMPAENVDALIQRVTGASVSEIDGVIAEMQSVRDILRQEGERVQREIAGYATLSQTAMASMKVIGESMAQWRAALGSNALSRYRD